MKTYQNEAKLRELYKEYRSGNKIAKLLGVKDETIYRWLKKFGISTAKTGSQGARKHSLNEHFFDVIDTEMKAYWLGFIMADGCVYHGSDKNSYRLQINLASKDRDILERFRQDLACDYAIVTKTRRAEKNCQPREMCELKINSTVLCKALMSHGIVPRKTSCCKIPNIPSKLHRHFVRGYFDGDGCISWKNGKPGRSRIDIVGNESFLEELQYIFASNGIESYIYALSSTTIVESLSIVNLDMIEAAYHYMYDQSTFYMLRKYDKFQTFLNYQVSRRTEMFGQ